MSRNDFILGRIGEDGKAEYYCPGGNVGKQPEFAKIYQSRSKAKLAVHSNWLVLPRDFMIALTGLSAALND